METKLIVFVVVAVLVAGGLFVLSDKLVENVESGTYVIRQAPFSGELSAWMEPGMYWQLWGGISMWPVAETFYFTADSQEGAAYDQSIEVRFNDGSMCKISGTCRIVFPTAPQDAINLVKVHGYRSYKDAEHKLVLTTIRNSLHLTSNLMSAQESYSEKRADFVFWAWDQIQNGVYETTEETKKVQDLITGELVTKTFKIIKRDASGHALHQKHPLQGTGITLANFEIKVFEYSDKVKSQIEKQQEALMAVATARARAQEAEQSALTKEAEGKAKVVEAKYEEEQKKVRSIVEASKEKEVAELQAKKELEVAKLQKDAADFNKQKNILEGEGEAKKKELILRADGALAQKLDAYIKVNQLYAESIAKYTGNWVPQVMMGQSNGNGTSQSANNGAQALIDLFTAKTARDLSLDLSMPSGQVAKDEDNSTANSTEKR